MERKKLRHFRAASVLLAAFVLWTAAVCIVDVQPIGPRGSAVGFASVNGFFHSLTGVHMSLYVITDWLSLIPVFVALGFALLGLLQWIRRRSLARVDRSLFALGGFYVLLLGAYIFFEYFVVNYRPMLIDGLLEASYPSSTTMLVIGIMSTAIMEFRERIGSRVQRRGVTILCLCFTAFMVLGRLLSGVHWLSDIVGGVLLSTGLVMLYGFARQK